jgi:hypothetical protein
MQEPWSLSQEKKSLLLKEVFKLIFLTLLFRSPVKVYPLAIGPYSISAGGQTTIVVGAEAEIETLLVTSVVTGSAIVSVTGESLSLVLLAMKIVADANVSLTGEEITSAQGSVAVVADANVSVTGQSLATAIGDETVTGSALVTLTGIPLTIVQGNVEAQAGADVDVTGEALSMAQGSVTVAIESGYISHRYRIIRCSRRCGCYCMVTCRTGSDERLDTLSMIATLIHGQKSTILLQIHGQK